MKNFSVKIEIFQKLMYKNAIKMLGRAIFERFYQIFGFLYPKTWYFLVFKVVFFFGVLRFPFGVFGPKLSGHTDFHQNKQFRNPERNPAFFLELTKIWQNDHSNQMFHMWKSYRKQVGSLHWSVTSRIY